MLESTFSNELQGEQPNFAPAAPVLSGITFVGRVAKIQVSLPIADADGGALTGLAAVNVFYKNATFVGSDPATERAAGTPIVTVAITPEQAGQVVEVDIPDLEFGKVYFFAATCND